MTEPNQLSIENFLELLESRSDDYIQLSLDGNGLDRTHQEIEQGSSGNSPESCKQHAKEENGAENWTAFDSRLLMDRKETSNYAQKVGKRHLKPACTVAPSFIQEYEESPLSREKQEAYLKEIMTGQRNSLIYFNSNYPYSVALSQRLRILETIFNSLSNKFHSSRVARSSRPNVNKARGKKEGENEVPQSRDVMVQLGVKTGLSLLFSLMKQAWTQSSESSELCSDVLNTVAGVISSLPPLSLANKVKLPKLAKSSLDQVMDFLRDIMRGKVMVDADGRRMCAEIFLGLALQRGSPLALLDWVETGVRSCLVSNQILLQRSTLSGWMKHIKSSGVSF